MEFLPNIRVEIGQDLAKNAKNLIFQLGFANKKIILISDENIWQNCKNFFAENIFDEKLILSNPKADEENIEFISEKIKNFDLVVALGSGVISDLCKYSSFKCNIPYLIFPSAPSMNGYLSKNASLTISAHKKTLKATLPIAVFCDLDILKTAPKNMIKAGVGDVMCFYGCWFDWLLSHLLLETKFHAESFEILSDKMNFFVNNYKDFSIFDDEFLKILIEILLLSGSSMTKAEGSYPASQSEHMIAHTFAMKYPQKEENILHGIQIATTSLTTARIQEELLSQENIVMRENIFEKEKIVKFFGAKIADECEKEYAQKSDLIRLNRKFINQELSQNWADYCQVLSRIFFSEQNLREIFKHFEIEVGHKALGLEYQEYNEIVSYAKFTRNRFTCLDF